MTGKGQITSERARKKTIIERGRRREHLLTFFSFFPYFFFFGYAISGEKVPLGRESRLRMRTLTPSGNFRQPCHGQWYLYYSTTLVKNVGKNYVTEEKNAGKNHVTERKNAGGIEVIEKNRRKNDVPSCDVTSGHVTDVTSGQSRSLPVAPHCSSLNATLSVSIYYCYAIYIA